MITPQTGLDRMLPISLLWGQLSAVLHPRDRDLRHKDKIKPTQRIGI